MAVVVLALLLLRVLLVVESLSSLGSLSWLVTSLGSGLVALLAGTGRAVGLFGDWLMAGFYRWPGPVGWPLHGAGGQTARCWLGLGSCAGAGLV